MPFVRNYVKYWVLVYDARRVVAHRSRVNFHNLPRIQIKYQEEGTVSRSNISARSAYEISKLPDPHSQAALAQEAVAGKLPHGQAARTVRQLSGKPKTPSRSTRAVYDCIAYGQRS